MATNLAIDTSDMDIAIYGAISAEKIAQSLNPRELAVTAMEQLSLRFEPIDWIVSNRVIGTASVPVIKIEIDTAKLAKTLRSGHAETDIKTLKIDIIFNDVALPRSKDADGLEVSEVHTKRAAEYVKQQITAHPFLRPLVVVLKKYLSLKNLNNSFMGTISSYGLVLMLIALLEDMKKSEPALERQTGDMFDF
jgi:DNA polymerase sigma